MLVHFFFKLKKINEHICMQDIFMGPGTSSFKRLLVKTG